MTAKLIDISQRLRTGLPVWPGDTPFTIEESWTMGPDCPVRVTRMTLSAQSGTHADAHSHFEERGDDMAATDLGAYIGPCDVIEVATSGGAISPEEVLPRLKSTKPERVLLKTFERFPTDHWPTTFRAISDALIDELGARGCLLIGTDAPSVDPEDSKTLDAHHAVHRHGMAILEGLVLDDVSAGTYELIALPIAIEGADASPVRAILRALPKRSFRYD